MIDRPRTFDRFNPHELCEIVEYDAQGPSLLTRTHTGKRVRHPMQKGLRLQASTLQAGRTVAVQFGDLPSMRSGGSGIVKGHIHSVPQRGIVAVQHLVPRTDVLSLAIIRAFGDDPDETLRQYVEGANTRVTQGRETGTDPCTGKRTELVYSIVAGMLSVDVDLAPGVLVRGGSVFLEGVLPDTVVGGLVGQRLADLVRHPVLVDPRIVISSIEPAASTPELVMATRIGVESPPVELARHGEQANLHFAA